MGKSPFAVGRRWFCDRSKDFRASFHFVVLPTPALEAYPGVGKHYFKTHKLCRLEPVAGDPYQAGAQSLGADSAQAYSHKHLQKYAVLVKE
jgi:hypothetical protein